MLRSILATGTNMTTNTYAGYTAVINDKIQISYHSSYKSDTKNNYDPSFIIKIGDVETYINLDDMHNICSVIDNMLTLNKYIPNKDNALDYHAFR